MIDIREKDQASGLRRLFRRTPPTVIALFAAGRHHTLTAVQAAYRIASDSGRVLILDEGTQATSLHPLLDLPEGPDLLGILNTGISAGTLLQPIPGMAGRIPVSAAALALPLLDESRRNKLIQTLELLQQDVSTTLIHAPCQNAADPSPFVSAAPQRLLVAEVSRSGATSAYQTIKQLAAAGAGNFHIAVARARDPQEARHFFTSLRDLVRLHIGTPLIWLGEIERNDIAAGLHSSRMQHHNSTMDAAAFLRRLALIREPRHGTSASAR